MLAPPALARPRPLPGGDRGGHRQGRHLPPHRAGPLRAGPGDLPLDGATSLRRYRIAGVAATAAIVLSVPLYLAARALRPPRTVAGRGAPVRGQREVQGLPREGVRRVEGLEPRARHAGGQGRHGAGRLLRAPRSCTAARPGASSGRARSSWPTPRGRTARCATSRWPTPSASRRCSSTWCPFPGGRLQTLSAAWDTKAKRWFHVDPRGAAPPGDWLHWTRPGQSWNAMCSDCHSTAVRKRYDPETDAYQTTWSEIMVGCEACHGPGSRHVAWAEQPAMGGRPPRTPGWWPRPPGSPRGR